MTTQTRHRGRLGLLNTRAAVQIYHRQDDNAVAVQAGSTPEIEDTLEPLFKSIIDEIPPPSVYPDAPLQLLVTNIDYDEHKGRICIARVNAGTITPGMQVRLCCLACLFCVKCVGLTMRRICIERASTPAPSRRACRCAPLLPCLQKT